jgi:putative ABC transport system permease protein
MVPFWRQLKRGVGSLCNGAAADRQVDEELQHFMEEATAAFEAEGMTPAEARRAAERRVGNSLSARETVRASGWEHAVETTASDIRYGVRRLFRNPGFTIVTVATLGVGIGSATAILSVAGPVLVETLPYPQASRIGAIWDLSDSGDRAAIAFGTFVEVEQRSRSFESMAVERLWQPTLNGFAEPERLEGRSISVEYFRVFGIGPRIGRAFEHADDQPNVRAQVIISDRLWRRRFEAAPDIVGRQIVLDGNGYDVIGVMPAAFEHRLMPAVDVWRALQYDRTLPSAQGREWGHHLRMFARLRDGVTVAEAIVELRQIARAPIPQIARPPWAAMPHGLLIDSLHGDLTRAARPAMLAVTAAAALLLVIACVNVVNLVFGRDAQRRAEFAMRAALGAGRLRLIRQLLTETLLLAACGGAVGLLVALAVIRSLVWFGPEGMTQAPPVTLNAVVFGIASVITAVVGVAVGLAPAVWRRDLTGVPQGSRQASASDHRMRRGLVAAEVAFALVLLVGAGLLFQSLRRLFAIDPGFDERHVLAAQVQVAGPGFRDDAATHRYFQQILDAVGRVPGVEHAALTSQLPLSGESDAYGVQFESRGVAAPESGAFRYAVSPGYFETMRIPLQQGRLLTEHDTATAPLAVLVSESLARSRFPNGNAIGQRLHAGPTNRPWFTVVGVVGDVKHLSLETDWFDAVYVSPPQWHFADRSFWLVIRAQVAAAALTPAIREAIWSVDRQQPIVRVSMLDAVVASTASARRFALLLFEAFGFAALFLTAVGIYGVTSSGVTYRIREIGVRTALGASRPAILRMVMSEGASMAAIGIVIGIAIAAAATRGLTALLYGVSRFEPLSYLGVALLMIGVAALACWLPARRATQIDPALTLRAE